MLLAHCNSVRLDKFWNWIEHAGLNPWNLLQNSLASISIWSTGWTNNPCLSIEGWIFKHKPWSAAGLCQERRGWLSLVLGLRIATRDALYHGWRWSDLRCRPPPWTYPGQAALLHIASIGHRALGTQPGITEDQCAREALPRGIAGPERKASSGEKHRSVLVSRALSTQQQQCHQLKPQNYLSMYSAQDTCFAHLSLETRILYRQCPEGILESQEGWSQDDVHSKICSPFALLS